MFSSKFEDDYRKTVTKYIADHPDSPAKIQIVTGDPQFTYFARFQLALLAKTRYVALLDDDTIPSGKMAFRNMFHTACLKSNAYLGMYGMKGHIISPYQNGGQHQYASFFEHMPERIVGADVVGGLWFMKREWIKFMFIEDPITISTGEDVHLT